MRVCEACGQRFDEPLERCARCGRPLVTQSAAGHLGRTSIAGNPGAISFTAATAVVRAAGSSQAGPVTQAEGAASDPAVEGTAAAAFDPGNNPRAAASRPGVERPAAGASEAYQTSPVTASGDATASPRARIDDGASVPSAPSSPEWDPDATTRFTPIYASHSRAKNTAALVGLAIGVVAAVTSLAGLIAQSVVTGPSTPRATAPVSASATPLSTVVPRNATVCTPELARSSDTNCTVAQRVFAGVRTLGTDLPDTFRVTITDPRTDKNATFVCRIKSWIECVGDDQATIYVRRLV